ncbi:hypothetical protein SEPCBS119000_002436 [Sporothrix epigloea]|uniref:Uncharacterized protein n=1 Tax=Sporothrix epigloea TaxID=1892477 RepID=A0ABP0DHW9_9PEZI
MATYSNSNAHPLPAAPVGGASMLPPAPVQHSRHLQQNQPPPMQAPRRESQTSRPKSRSFSFRSDRSQKSAGLASQKLEPETHDEKEAKRLHSKADPTLAIFEAEPSAVAATVKSSLAPLRSIVHKDNNGNPIAEPDKSNPTRYRWERPLDTIRSFEAAIDGGYTRQNAYSNDNEQGNFSRRGSYFTQSNNSARYPQDSYYGRPQSHMYTSASAHDLRQNMHARGDNYHDQGGYNNNGGGYGYGNGSRQRYSRIQSDSQIHSHMGQMNGSNNVYPISSNHRSYETVASGAGSSGTSGEPAGYLTDPTSSDNSSIERRQSPSKLNMMGQGYQGFSGPQNGGYSNGGYSNYNGGVPKRVSPSAQLSSSSMRLQPPSNQMGQMQSRVSSPSTSGVITKKPIASSQQPAQKPTVPEKRKSWLSKRFSRQN